tara:strand:+ start:49 stop:1062 length:1014 start_codon:yes stop_codon:yes gene_type:complete
MKISREEQLIIDILFAENKLKKKDFENINFEKFVNIASLHLILPTIYIRLKKQHYLNFIPKDLKKYLSQINNLNLDRNRNLVDELKELSKILDYNDIDYIFIKGSAHIISNIYTNISERMIGDIDFLFNPKQLEKVKYILKQNKFKSKIKYSFFEFRHLKRMVKKGSLFAIEPHLKIIDKEIKNLNFRNILNDKIYCSGFKIPGIHEMILINIVNYQINDYGSRNLSYSYKSFYDTFLLLKHENIDFNKILLNKHILKYFFIMDQLKIELNYKFNFKNFLLTKIRFKLKRQLKIIFMIDNFITFFLMKIETLPKQIFKLIKSREYRNYALKKILNKL